MNSDDELAAFLASASPADEADELATFLQRPEPRRSSVPFTPDTIRPIASHTPAPRPAVDMQPTPEEQALIAQSPPEQTRRPFQLHPPRVLPPMDPDEVPRRSRTGAIYTPRPLGTMPILDAPAEGLPQMGQGALRLGRSLSTPPAPATPLGRSRTGQLYQAPGVDTTGLMTGAADVLEGALKAGEPAMVGTGLGAPLETAAALTAGELGQRTTAAVLPRLGVSPEATRLASDVAGLVTGGMGAGGARRFRLRPRPAVSEPAAMPRPSSAAANDVTSPTPATSALAATAPDELETFLRQSPPTAPETAPAAPPRAALADSAPVAARQPTAATEGPPASPATEHEPPSLTVRVSSAADLSPDERRELRRIVHELDAMPFTPRLLQPERYGGGLEHVEGTGGAGAAVYDDIAQAPSAGTSQPTRGELQGQLEKFLGGTGKPTKSVQAAVEIARLRALGGPRRIPGDGNLSTAELPPSAGEVPTRLEAKPEAAPEPSAVDESVPPEAPEADVDELAQWFADQAAEDVRETPEASPLGQQLAGVVPDETPLSVRDFAQALTREGEKGLVDQPFTLTPEAAAHDASQADLFRPEKPTFGQWLGQKANKPTPPSIGFQSTLLPGAAELVDQDLAPRVRSALGAAREVRGALSPQTASVEAQRAADIVREAHAQMVNLDAIERSRMSRIARHFDGQSDDANIANIAAYERTGQFAAEPIEGYSAYYRKTMDLAGRLLEQAYGGNIVGKVENYVRRAFVFGSKADEAAGTHYLTTKLYSLSANKSPLKARVLEMPLDEALADMRARGLTVRMQTSNPELLRQWSLANARQAVAYKDAWTRLKENGLIRYVRSYTRPPSSMVPLEDRVATVFKSPFIDVQEARDASVMEGLADVAKGLGVDLERKVSIGGPRSAGGGTVWGYSVQGGNSVVTKFAGDESVLAHEIGHQIDDKFGLWNRLKQLEQQYKAQGYEDWSLQDQLRKVTDLTWEGKQPEEVSKTFREYVRQKDEKMANLISAYVHAPEKLKAVAPDVFNVLDELVDTTPALQPLREIEPGIRLTTGEGQVHAGGAVVAGRYYADPTVARVLNNTISRGLGPSWDGVKALNNSLNQLQLGLSGFHLTGTAINAGVSDVALGIRQLARGDVAKGAGAIARGAALGTSFTRDLLQGRALVEGLKANSPEAYAVLKDKLNPAGGRLNLDAPYRAQMSESMRRAWSNQNYLGAAWRAPFALVQTIAKPLMEYAVPRVKLGAFLDLARDIDERLHNAEPTEKARAYAQAWDSIDNRFGQLVYDNLFWNKTARDLAHLGFRSVGWNLGTLRELGPGATTDVARALRGQGVSDRLLYTFTLPVYVGLMGAIYQYLHTGHAPQEIKDYFYPKNGRLEPNGMVSRTTLPTYMKDVDAYSSHPLMTAWHKQSPLLALTRDLASNETYFGDMIRNPEDPVGQQLAQVGQYVLKDALPFSVQQFARAKQETATPEGKAESFLGFVKAPASMERTPAETMIHEFLGPRPARTPEQVEQAGVRADLRDAIGRGDKDTIRALAGQASKPSLERILRSASLTGTQTQFKRLSLEQQLKVYAVASEQERAAFKPLFGNLDARLANLPPADVPNIVARMRELGILKKPLRLAAPPVAMTAPSANVAPQSRP